MINPTTSTRTNGLTNNGQPAKSKRPLATKSNPSNDELQSLRAKVEAIEKSQAVIEFALDGTILTASEKFLQIFGYRLSDIQEKPHSIFVEAATASGADYKAFLHDLAEGNVAAGKFKRLAKGGKEVWIQASYSPVLDAEGLPVKIVKLATDCTEQHKLAEEVAELRVRAEITNLTSIVSESDLKGDILNVNEKFIEVSKYSREELIGKPHNTTRHPDMPKEVFKELWSTIGRGKPFRGIIKNRAKDGTPYYVDAVIAPVLGENGKPRKYIGVRYDITVAEIERQNAKGIQERGDRRPPSPDVCRTRLRQLERLHAVLDGVGRGQEPERCLQADRERRQGGLDPGGLCAGEG